MRVKMSKQPPPAPTASAEGPGPTIIQIVGRPGTGNLPSTIAPPDHPQLDLKHKYRVLTLKAPITTALPITTFPARVWRGSAERGGGGCKGKLLSDSSQP